MKGRKRICFFTGDWEAFEILELEFDIESDEEVYRKKIKNTSNSRDKRSERLGGFEGTDSESELTGFIEDTDALSGYQDSDFEIMCVKRRASSYFIASFFAVTTLFILGIALGTEHWVHAGLQRDLSKLQNDTDQTLPLKGYIGANPIDGSDPGAFRGVMRFGLFSGCKRFNYGLGVRDPKCFSGSK